MKKEEPGYKEEQEKDTGDVVIQLPWWKKALIVLGTPFIIIAGIVGGIGFSFYSIYTWLAGRDAPETSFSATEKNLSNIPKHEITHSSVKGKKLEAVITQAGMAKVAGTIFAQINNPGISKFDDKDSYYISSTKSVVNGQTYRNMQAIQELLKNYQTEVMKGLKEPIEAASLIMVTNKFLAKISDDKIKQGSAGVISGFLREVINPNKLVNQEVFVSCNESKDGYFKLASLDPKRSTYVSLRPEKEGTVPAILFEVTPQHRNRLGLIVTEDQKIEGIASSKGAQLLLGSLFPRLDIYQGQTEAVLTLGGNTMYGAGIVDFTSDVSPFQGKADAIPVSINNGQQRLSHSESNSGIIEGGGCNKAYTTIADGLARLAHKGGSKDQIKQAAAMTYYHNSFNHGRQVKNEITAEVIGEYIGLTKPTEQKIRRVFVAAVDAHEGELSSAGKGVLAKLKNEDFYKDGYPAVANSIMSNPMIPARAQGRLGNEGQNWSPANDFELTDFHQRKDVKAGLTSGLTR